MTNYEKFKNTLMDALALGYEIGLYNGKVVDCFALECKDCEFNSYKKGNGVCWPNRLAWLNSEVER